MERNNDILEINVGGRVFTSLRGTFCKDPNSMLCELFESSFQHARDASGRIFIDGDSDSFEYVLLYLRRDQTDLEAVLEDLTTVQRKRLLVEARFYRLQGLIDILEHNVSKEKSDPIMEPNENEVIDINVGGRIFTCPRATLYKHRDSMLGAMFAPDSPFKTYTTDPSGRIFIDRNGDLFSHVLEYLRHDQAEHLANLPPFERKLLLAEAEYYSLQGLVEFLNKKLEKKPLEIVEVSVRGRVFAFPRTTVTEKAPDSFLAKIISGGIECPKDLHGRLFFDRDPIAFDFVRRSLNQGRATYELRKECVARSGVHLEDEIRYFGLNQVVRIY